MQIQISGQDRSASRAGDEVLERTRDRERRALVAEAERQPAECVCPTREETVDELRLAAHVETKLRSIYPCEVVKVENNVFTVDVEAPLLWEATLAEKYNSAVKNMPAVKGIRVHILPSGLHGLG